MNDKGIFFSVVLPSYNRAEFIDGTIRSVQNQQYQNWELIVVNDGSTDKTENIVKSIQDDRIKYILIPNSERGAARNTGIKSAQGDFICFLDSDDQLLPNHLSTAATFISTHPQIKVFHQGYKIQNQQGKVLYSSEKLPKELNKLLIRNNVVSPNGIFISKDIIKKNLFVEERSLAGTEDYELWLRLSCQYQVLHNEVFTSILVDHQQRSMKETELQKLLLRINFFLKSVEENSLLKNWMGKRYREFKSWRYSYVALHSALSNHYKISLRYALRAFLTWPAIIFTKRFYIIFYRFLT